jgi:hypothetical protein
MVEVVALWLPILVSAVFVFLVSSVFHMLLPIHKNDYGRMPEEDRVLAALRGVVPAGQYRFPYASSMKDMGSPEMQAKFKQGPIGTIVIQSGMNMGKALGQWFVFCLVAYLTGLALPAGTEYMRVFRIAGTVAVLAHAFSNVNDSIWKGVTWDTTLRFAFDGLVYGLVTAGTFAWLWPAAA